MSGSDGVLGSLQSKICGIISDTMVHIPLAMLKCLFVLVCLE